jgi:hypothetical protein
MAQKDLDPKDIARKAKETSEIVEDALRSISSQIGDIFKEALDTTSSFSKTITNDITKGINNLARNSTVLLSNQEKLNSGGLTRLQVEKQIAERTIKIAAIQQQINIAKNAGLITGKQADKQLKQALLYEDEFISNLNEQANLADQFNKKLGITGNVIKGLNKIPVLGGLIESEEVLAKIQKETSREGSSRFSVFKEGVKGVGSSLKDNLTDPSVLMGGGFAVLTKVVKFFVDAMFGADERVTDIAKNLSISKDSARGIYDNIKGSKTEMDTMYRTTANISEAFNDISQLTGFSTIATNDQIESQIVLTKQLGQSKEEALGLQETFAISNTEAGKGVDIVYDQIAAFANQNKIVADGRKILQEVSKTSKLIQLNFKGNVGELTKSVLEAKKLGLTLDQVSKIGDSLLNFEQSIANELEAELLTGQNINLEKAREYALNNDIAGLTQEIAKQGITTEKFSRMNRIQQEAIAKTLGMSSEELADSLYKQQVIDKVAGNYTKQLREQAKAAHDRGDTETEIRLEKEASLVEQGILEGKNLETAQKSASAQEKFNVAVERIKEVFSDLVNGGVLDKLVEYLDQFVGSLESGSSILGTLVFGPDSKADIASSRKSSLEEQLLLTKDEAEKKKLQDRISKQDEAYKLAKKEEKTRDEYMKVRPSVDYKDFKKEYEAKELSKKEISSNPITPSTKIETADDFIIRPGQPMVKFRKDDIIVGGTSLGKGGNEEVTALLKELISSVKSGGNVYLDGTKVGTAMNVSTYRVQ